MMGGFVWNARYSHFTVHFAGTAALYLTDVITLCVPEALPIVSELVAMKQKAEERLPNQTCLTCRLLGDPI